jgi:hypothetical protein
MNTSLLTSTAALGLTPLRWNAFSQANPGASYVPLAASFTPTRFEAVVQLGSSSYLSLAYRFWADGSQPAWVKPGTGLCISAGVTINGTTLDLSGSYLVKSVSAEGKYFEVNAPSPNGVRDAVSLNQPLGQMTFADSPAVSVALLLQAQKAMLCASEGTVSVAPVVDGGSKAPYSVSLTAGNSEYELTAQTGSKFDLGDWLVSGSGTLSVRFI